MPEIVVTDTDRPDLGGNLRHGDDATHCPALWHFLVERFGITSMLDVGCGEGHAVAFFRRLGVIAHGIDGLKRNVDRAVTPIALHDLLSGPYYMPVDLVWSCEVAEHIHRDKVDHYIDTLANGRIVAMTHATPGQDGYHHVNCQPASYWITLMGSRGYTVALFNDNYRAVAGSAGGFNYFMKTGIVFFRD